MPPSGSFSSNCLCVHIQPGPLPGISQGLQKFTNSLPHTDGRVPHDLTRSSPKGPLRMISCVLSSPVFWASVPPGSEGFDTKAQGRHSLQQVWDTAWQGQRLPEAPALNKGAPGTHPENGSDHTHVGATGCPSSTQVRQPHRPQP